MRVRGMKIIDDSALEDIIQYIESIENKDDCTFNIIVNGKNIKLDTNKIIWDIAEHSTVGGIELDYAFGHIINSDISVTTSYKISIDSDIMILPVPKAPNSIYLHYPYIYKVKESDNMPTAKLPNIYIQTQYEDKEGDNIGNDNG